MSALQIPKKCLPFIKIPADNLIIDSNHLLTAYLSLADSYLIFSLNLDKLREPHLKLKRNKAFLD